jgi:lysophospholipase L1-like esterase
MPDVAEAILNKIQSGERFRVGFLGDSLTSAEWVHPNWREVFEYVVKEHYSKMLGDWRVPSWGIRFYNFAFDGSTTQDWLDILETEVLALPPDLLIVLGTHNDYWFKLFDQSAFNVETVVRRSLRGGISNVLYSPGFAGLDKTSNFRYRPIAKACLLQAKEAGAEVVDLHTAFEKLGRGRFYTFTEKFDNSITGKKAGSIDASHPNALGNAYVAKLLLKHLFGINFDPEAYLGDLRADVKYPRWSAEAPAASSF